MIIMQTDLETFYEVIGKDQDLMKELGSISDRVLFLNKILELGHKGGFRFTKGELDDAIKMYTAQGQGDYCCLPIGCWSIGRDDPKAKE